MQLQFLKLAFIVAAVGIGISYFTGGGFELTEGSPTTTESEREVILNEVLTDLATASCLLYGTEDSASVQYGDFYVDDPDELERIMTEIQALLGTDWQSCTLTRYDNDYQNAKESLQGPAKYRFLSRLP